MTPSLRQLQDEGQDCKGLMLRDEDGSHPRIVSFESRSRTLSENTPEGRNIFFDNYGPEQQRKTRSVSFSSPTTASSRSPASTESSCGMFARPRLITEDDARSATQHRETVKSGDSLRVRYLERLGIQRHTSSQRHGHSQAPSPSCYNKRQSSARQRSDSFQEVLKNDHGKPDEKLLEEASSASGWTASCSSSASSLTSLSSRTLCTTTNNIANSPMLPAVKSPSKTSSAVSFDATVTVHPIPSRNAYSDRIRKHLWFTEQEQQTSVARNCIEFAAENWNPNAVYMDSDMVVAPQTGERVHPVHFVESPYTQSRLSALLQKAQYRDHGPQSQHPQG